MKSKNGVNSMTKPEKDILKMLQNFTLLMRFLRQHQSRIRSSHRRCSLTESVLRSFAKLTGKHLCQSLFFNKDTLAQVFSCEFYKISKNTFFIGNLPATSSEEYKMEKRPNLCTGSMSDVKKLPAGAAITSLLQNNREQRLVVER